MTLRRHAISAASESTHYRSIWSQKKPGLRRLRIACRMRGSASHRWWSAPVRVKDILLDRNRFVQSWRINPQGGACIWEKKEAAGEEKIGRKPPGNQNPNRPPESLA